MLERGWSSPGGAKFRRMNAAGKDSSPNLTALHTADWRRAPAHSSYAVLVLSCALSIPPPPVRSPAGPSDLAGPPCKTAEGVDRRVWVGPVAGTHSGPWPADARTSTKRVTDETQASRKPCPEAAMHREGPMQPCSCFPEPFASCAARAALLLGKPGPSTAGVEQYSLSALRPSLAQADDMHESGVEPRGRIQHRPRLDGQEKLQQVRSQPPGLRPSRPFGPCSARGRVAGGEHGRRCAAPAASPAASRRLLESVWIEGGTRMGGVGQPRPCNSQA
ncbi:hypothetical protein CDD83_5966 [Cordyceps sp. RAO-2017]|nr:hypothetical protein CDD83_5966 [Cordyceps sp. RAO-2017]